jgi:hypothetical protein
MRPDEMQRIRESLMALWPASTSASTPVDNNIHLPAALYDALQEKGMLARHYRRLPENLFARPEPTATTDGVREVLERLRGEAGPPEKISIPPPFPTPRPQVVVKIFVE